MPYGANLANENETHNLASVDTNMHQRKVQETTPHKQLINSQTHERHNISLEMEVERCAHTHSSAIPLAGINIQDKETASTAPGASSSACPERSEGIKEK